MTDYRRPIPTVIWSDNAVPLAGGPLLFSDVEKIERGAVPMGIGAADLLQRPDGLASMARVPICGLPVDRPLVMAVINTTPDSFSDGGRFLDPAQAQARVATALEEGADILDIGGESTRPGADAVPADEEIARITPALDAAIATGAVVSVDTRKASVAAYALERGARLFNDVSAGTYDIDSPRVMAEFTLAGGAACLMHALGDPKTMQDDPRYDHVLLDVYDHLAARLDAVEAAGARREALISDPGIGFGKSLEHNLALLRGLSLFHTLGVPVLLGASRKRFIGTITGRSEAAQRMPGSVAAALWAASQGAQILRVHDVRETVEALRMWSAISTASPVR